ncbi:hypothetical protein HPB47_026986, partial [Ixodes persulcatus]
MPETRSGTSTVPPSVADSSDKKANRGAVDGADVSLELERERILLRQMEIQLKLAELNARSGARAGRAERDPEIETGEALKHYSKVLHGAIPKFPHDAEVPVWFETVEFLFQRYAVPVEVQAHLVYPLIATRLAYLCASMKNGEFTFGHRRSVVLAELRLSAEEYRKRFTAASKRSDETWKQFATRTASYLQCYLEAKGVTEFSNLSSLLVADRMKESMGQSAREYVTLREGKDWLNPAGMADLLAVYDTAKGTARGPVEEETRGSGRENRRHDGGPSAGPPHAPPRNCHVCGGPSHRAAECTRTRETKASTSHANVRPVVVLDQPGPDPLTMRVASPSGSVTLESAFGERVKAKSVALPMFLVKPDTLALEEVCGAVSVMCALTNDLAPHTDCFLSLDAWEALSTGARHDTNEMRADVFGRTHPDMVVCAAQMAAGTDEALYCAEPSLNCYDAGQLITSRTQLQTTDDESAVGKMKQRSGSFGTHRDDPTLATAIRDSGLALRGTFVETCALGNPTAPLGRPQERRGDVSPSVHESPWGGNLGNRKAATRIKLRCPPWRQKGGSTYGYREHVDHLR